jgi:UDP-3-O-[3-hydroxymyristoyl] glucosamine N-acyltransferase
MQNKQGYTLSEIAQRTNCKLIGNPSHCIYNVSDLQQACSHDASFLANPRYLQAMKNSQAGVIFIDSQTSPLEGKNYLVSDDPSRSFQHLVETFYPPNRRPSGFVGIHPTALIHPSAQIGSEVTVGPYAVIDENVVIGDRTFIGAYVYIGPDSKVGSDCLFHPRAVVREQCFIGNRVIIQPGAVIGSCGFGYTTDQVGDVRIEDEVEIGANATIDRARFKSTVIGKGSKIDNLVQIGHGVIIGAHNIIVAQTGIAGSTTTGKYVVLAGQVAVAGHLHLEDGVTVAGKSGVSKSLAKGKYGGIPAVPLADYNRNQVFLRHIEDFVKQTKQLEERIHKLEALQNTN